MYWMFHHQNCSLSGWLFQIIKDYVMNPNPRPAVPHVMTSTPIPQMCNKAWTVLTALMDLCIPFLIVAVCLKEWQVSRCIYGTGRQSKENGLRIREQRVYGVIRWRTRPHHNLCPRRLSCRRAVVGCSRLRSTGFRRQLVFNSSARRV